MSFGGRVAVRRCPFPGCCKKKGDLRVAFFFMRESNVLMTEFLIPDVRIQ